MTTLEIADEKRTIANLLHCATQYQDRDPARAAALRKEAGERQSVLDAPSPVGDSPIAESPSPEVPKSTP